MFSKYCALSVLGSRVWSFWVTWRHRLLLVVLWNQNLSLMVTKIFNGRC